MPAVLVHNTLLVTSTLWGMGFCFCSRIHTPNPLRAMSDIAELWRLQREKGVVQVPGSHGQETKDPRWGSQPGKGSLVPELMELIVILKDFKAEATLPQIKDINAAHS